MRFSFSLLVAPILISFFISDAVWADDLSTPFTQQTVSPVSNGTNYNNTSPAPTNNQVLCDPNGSSIQGSVADGTSTNCSAYLNNGSANSGSNTTTVNVYGGSNNQVDSDCHDDHKTAETDCITGGQTAQMAQFAQLLAGNTGAGAGPVGQCISLKSRGYTSMAGVTAIYARCRLSLTNCNESCTNAANLETNASTKKMETKMATDCTNGGKIGSQVLAAIGPMLVNATGSIISAESCEQQLAEAQATSCQNPNNAASFACNAAAYCATHSFDPQCASINQAAACNNPATAAGNPLCSAMNNHLSTTPPGTNTDSGDSDDYRNKQDYTGKSSPPTPDSGGGGGAGGGFGGPGGYPGGGQANGGGGHDGGIKTDIGGGVGGGSSSGGVTMGNAMNGNGSGRGGADDKLDLSRFLPNGDLANRGLASVNDLVSKGITGANDLSNFEKITRLMNQKRKILAQ